MELYYLSSKNKGADQLRSNAPLFLHMQIVGFLMSWLIYCYKIFKELTDLKSLLFTFSSFFKSLNLNDNAVDDNVEWV